MPYRWKGVTEFICPSCGVNPVIRKSTHGRLPHCEECKEATKARLLKDQRDKRASGEWDGHRNRETGLRYGPIETYQCSYCGDSFEANGVSKSVPVCKSKDCLLAHGAALGARKSDRRKVQWTPEKRRERFFKKLGLAGLTEEWYQNEISRGCGICKTLEPGVPGWQVDHDHSCCPHSKFCSKCVRGILCHRCNLAIGLFQDDPERLRAAIAWVE